MDAPAAAPGLARNLILCLDGTSNQFSPRNTNVIKLFSVIDITPGLAPGGQMAYYDSGVGTYLPVGASSSWSEARQAWAKNLDLAVAWNFDDHVKNAYKWLMDYYQPGDKIFLFGFSRGAYAVRVLAGMIQKVGLLPAGNYSQIPLAYDVYKSPSDVQRRGHFESPDYLARKYRGIFGISREVVVHFIGVWDTVSSLGGVSAPDLPFANTVSSVNYFRQALALDERRVKFQPEFRRIDYRLSGPGKNIPEERGEKTNGIARNKEVWFLGVHTSVGGGSDPDEGPSLSNVPFRWMLWEAVQCGLRTGPISMLQMYALMAIPTVKTHLETSLPNILALFRGDPVLPWTEVQDPQFRVYIASQFTARDREDVVRLAALYDTTVSTIAHEADAGLPMTPDLMSRKHESLSGPAYIAMDYIISVLQCRRYEIDDSGDYVEIRERRRHWGDGRYIQHDQKIHRSVLKRLLFDQAVAQNHIPPPGDASYEPFPALNAHIPPVNGARMANYWDYPRQGADVEWNTLMAPANRGLELWEVA